MNRITRIWVTGAFSAALLLGSTVHAKTSATTTSTTTSTTSTTLPSGASGFSKATSTCIKHATSAKKMCKFQAAVVDCTAQFITDFSNCFAPGKGVTCAASCETKKEACSTKAATDKTSCTAKCKKSKDPTCKPTCTANDAAAKQKCTTSLNSCIAKCPNL